MPADDLVSLLSAVPYFHIYLTRRKYTDKQPKLSIFFSRLKIVFRKITKSHRLFLIEKYMLFITRHRSPRGCRMKLAGVPIYF